VVYFKIIYYVPILGTSSGTSDVSFRFFLSLVRNPILFLFNEAFGKLAERILQTLKDPAS
jgi:hypothetical protein